MLSLVHRVTKLPRKGYRGQGHRNGLALLTRNNKHFSVKMKSLSGVVNKITGDNCKCIDKRRVGHEHGSGSLPILHHAVTWSLISPIYNDTIHLTGVYIFPDENQLQEFFDTLTAHSNHPPHEPHIYAGDFNAYTAEELKNHVTPQELRTLLCRSGDVNPAHSFAQPLTSATVPAADYKGRLLLNMMNSLDFIITDCRFPVPLPTLQPYTFFENRTPTLSLTTTSSLNIMSPSSRSARYSAILSPPASQTICLSTFTLTCPPHPPLLSNPLLNHPSLAPCTTLNASKTRKPRKHSQKHELKKCHELHPPSRNCTPKF